MDRIEERLNALERKVSRYRNAAVALALALTGFVLLGATTDNGIQDGIRTRGLFVHNAAGQPIVFAGQDARGNGLLVVTSQETGQQLVFAGADSDGNGRLTVRSKDNENIVDFLHRDHENPR